MLLIHNSFLTFAYTPSVRSRQGRKNRAPPPRVRFNKDGKKINPQQQQGGK
jgi:hypothetical protein